VCQLIQVSIEPVNADDWRQYLETYADDWRQYLETFAFFKGLEVSDECEEDWEEVMQAVERMSTVLMGRVAAAA
jgi:hypothetical protein